MVEFTYIDDRTLSVTFPQTSERGIVSESSFGAVPMHIFAPVIGWNEDEHGLEYEYTVETDEEGNEVIVESRTRASTTPRSTASGASTPT